MNITRLSWTERKRKKDILQKGRPSHDKNTKNAIFRTRDEGTSILGERYNAGDNCRSKEYREAVDGRHQKYTQLVA